MVRRRSAERPSDRATLAPGVLAVPNVRLVRKIAEGGMGSVWEAEHLALRTNVAVKFVLDELGENEEAAARFNREATAAARIKSPHVTQVLDHGVTSEGVAYIVMELLEGEDLETRLERDKKLPLELAVHILLQSSKALDKAHTLGIVHRDIKPSNVFLTDVGGEVFVKILDFGIAKLSLADVAQMRVTQTGAMIGTPVFMAPEQMTQAKDVGPAADMWSLGVVAYLMVTGKLPHDAETVAGLAMSIERGGFPAVSTLIDAAPAGIDAWFEKALAKDPTKRFATIREMADAMAKIAGTHVPVSAALSAARTPSTPAPPMPSASKQALEKATGNKPPTDKAAPEPDEPAKPSADAPEEKPAEESVSPALATTLQAGPSPMTHATIMGASSEKARQEARSSTRTWVYAGIAVVLIGGGAALYGLMQSAKEPAQTTTAQASASASSSAEVRNGASSAKDRSLPPRTSNTAAVEPSDTASASAAPAPSDSSTPEASASVSASAAPSVRPHPVPNRLPTAAPSGPGTSAPVAPTATPSATAAPSAKPAPPPTATPTAAPKTSAAPTTAPKASAAPPPPKK